MKKRCIAAFILTLSCATPSVAAEKDAVAPDRAGAGDAGMNRMIRNESKQPMNMNEPMPIGMAKKGMKKGDVKAHAAKKEAVLDEMMKREEMKR